MKKEKHHYVPVCYQKNYLDDKGYIYVVDKKNIETHKKVVVRQTHPNNECFIYDYYKLTDSIKALNPKFQNLDEYFIENHVFKEFENKYQKDIYESIRTTKTLSRKSALLLIKSLIQLKNRNPNFKNQTIESIRISDHSQIVATLVDQALQDDRFRQFPRELLEAVGRSLDHQYTSNTHYSDFLHLLGLINRDIEPSDTLEKVYKNLFEGTWLLLINKNGDTPFIYTDNPGYSANLENNTILNTKFDKSFAYFLPLSPRYCLCISDNKKDRKIKSKPHIKKLEVINEIDIDTINLINRSAISVCNSRIFSNNKTYLTNLAERMYPQD